MFEIGDIVKFEFYQDAFGVVVGFKGKGSQILVLWFDEEEPHLYSYRDLIKVSK